MADKQHDGVSVQLMIASAHLRIPTFEEKGKEHRTVHLSKVAEHKYFERFCCVFLN